MQLTVTSWNINSVRLRIGMVGEFLTTHAPDVLCLQETKTPDEQFPAKAFHQLGYVHQAFIGQKGYNGVAIVSKLPFSEKEAMSMCGRNDARHMTVTLDKAAGAAAGIAIHNFYIPAGGDLPDPEKNDKFAHKLAFLDEIGAWGVTKKPTERPAILLGDLNIAHTPQDVSNWRRNVRSEGFLPQEREWFGELVGPRRLVDVVRSLHPEADGPYSWWSWLGDSFVNDTGWRIDYHLATPRLARTAVAAVTDREESPAARLADHAPVVVDYDLA